MKKKILLKTLIPLASVGITLGAVLPLASCSCGNNSSYEQDTIKFNELHSMTVGEEQTITATSSLNKEVTISASGNNLGNWWKFEDGKLKYLKKTATRVTISITAEDDTTENTTAVDLLPVQPQLTVDKHLVVSVNQPIAGVVDSNETISNLALAPKTVDNDNDRFNSITWASGNTFTTTIKGSNAVPPNGTWRLQVIINDEITTTVCSITLKYLVPDDTYWTWDSSNTFNASPVTAALDLSNQTSKLKGLMIGYSTIITELQCQTNALTTLDVSNCPNITTLNCSNNQLSTLEVLANPSLQSLTCNNNSLSALDVSNCPDITTLDCSYAQLNILDVSNCQNITTLKCNNNSLSILDVSKNLALTSLACSDNQLNVLDVSKNLAITSLTCANNLLSTLDVSSLSSITTLYCTSNELNDLYLPNRNINILMIYLNDELSDIYTKRLTGNQFVQQSPSNNAQYTYHLKPGSNATFSGKGLGGADIIWNQGADW